MYNFLYGMSSLSTDLSVGMMILFSIIVIWDAVWKAIGMWKSARNNQLAWFICILIFNTAGILPIIYIAWFQKKAKKK